MRLEIVRALSFDPRVLILDEPTGLLAPSELSGFLDLLRGLRDRGRIVILITHKLGEAMAVADRITMLRGGPRRRRDLTGTNQRAGIGRADGRRAVASLVVECRAPVAGERGSDCGPARA